jgi:hypothetical protein
MPLGSGVTPFVGGGVIAGGSALVGVVIGGVAVVGAGVGVTTGGAVITVDAEEPAIGMTVETVPAVEAPRCVLALGCMPPPSAPQAPDTAIKPIKQAVSRMLVHVIAASP